MGNKKVSIAPEPPDEIAIRIRPGDRVLVPTGLILDIPEGHSVRLHTRSSISLKKGLIMPNGEGIIDSDYYHQTFVMLYNASADEVLIENGERIAQGELVKTLSYSIEETKDVPEQKTDRVGGFGSTGVK
jgi:dUTP pyrophosphatase